MCEGVPEGVRDGVPVIERVGDRDALSDVVGVRKTVGLLLLLDAGMGDAVVLTTGAGGAPEADTDADAASVAVLPLLVLALTAWLGSALYVHVAVPVTVAVPVPVVVTVVFHTVPLVSLMAPALGEADGRMMMGVKGAHDGVTEGVGRKTMSICRAQEGKQEGKGMNEVVIRWHVDEW